MILELHHQQIHGGGGGGGIRVWCRIMALAVTQSVSVLGRMGVCRNETACLFSTVGTAGLFLPSAAGEAHEVGALSSLQISQQSSYSVHKAIICA